MANRYAVAAGGNWTANGTWSTTDGGAADTVAPTASDDVFLTANSGNVTISANSVGKSLNCTGYTGTLTHNGFSLTLSGNLTMVAGMTYTPTENVSCVLSFIVDATITTGGKLVHRVQLNGTNADLTLGDNLSFWASKTTHLNMVSSGTTVILNGFTVSGNSATNRVLVLSNTLGTARTITNTTGTFANADFRDITLSTAADLSAITGLSGDCGGNTNITFTTAATQTATGNSANWSTSTWTSRVPLPQDDVVLSLTAGQTLTNDMPRMGKSISVTTAMILSTNTVAQTLYGGLDLTNLATFTVGTTGSWTFEGRGSHTITSAGKTFGSAVTINPIGGTYTLGDAFSNTNAGISHSAGTINDGGFSVSLATQYFTSNNPTLVKSGTWTISGTGTKWTAGTSASITDTGTIILSDTSASSKTFTGSGRTYNDLLINGGGAGAIIITGANTFNRIYTDGGGTKSITLQGSTTTTIASGLGLANGTNVITFTASAGSATVAKSGGGTVGWDYLNLTNIIASTANTWYAGANSTDGGGNTNWIFTAPPATNNGSSFGGSLVCLIGK